MIGIELPKAYINKCGLCDDGAAAHELSFKSTDGRGVIINLCDGCYSELKYKIQAYEAGEK